MKIPSFEQLEQARQKFINKQKIKEFNKLNKEIIELSNEIWKGINKMKEEKFKGYFKLIKQYPDSGHELGDIVQGIDLSLSAVKNREYWQPVKTKFTRDEIIEIFKNNNLYILNQDMQMTITLKHILMDFGLSINDITR